MGRGYKPATRIAADEFLARGLGFFSLRTSWLALGRHILLITLGFSAKSGAARRQLDPGVPPRTD